MPGHKISPRQAARLDGFWRRQFMPGRDVIAAARPGPDEDWADVGCGPGFHTTLLARRARAVHALDLSPDMAAMAAAKAARLGLDNVRAAACGEVALPLPDAAVHGVLLAYVAHEFSRPVDSLAEVARVLAPGGRALVVEFGAGGLPLGPPPGHRITPDQLLAWAEAAGLAPGQLHRWTRRFLGLPYLNLWGQVLLKS